jgi:N-methylhydantoinase B/oxoprolinase/acetone carboxylase alpha subunit
VKTPGGGGWGDPRARERASVARDLKRGYISAEVAGATYAYAEPDHEHAAARAIAPVKMT